MTELRSLQAALSHPRWATYERVAARHAVKPAALYAWNMQMCGALLAPLHICEVVIRNAVAAALAHRYGPRWPWHAALLRSLPAHGTLAPPYASQDGTGRAQDVPEVIAGLRFAFWQHLFSRRFEQPIWALSLNIALPHAARTSIPAIRRAVHADLDRVRQLRNRIAHHEPIMERDLAADLSAMRRLVHARCPRTLAWLQRHEQASTVLARSPLANAP